jgi:hypothetical protein
MLISRKKFAELAGVDYKIINVYVGRKKIVPSGDYIDTELKPNKLFLEKKGVNPNGEKILPIPQILNGREMQHREPNMEGFDTSSYGLDAKKKKLEIDKLDVEVKIKRIQESKLKGEMLPAPMVKDIFAQHTKHLVSEFQNTMDKVLTRVTQLTKLDNSQVSEFREMITNEINQAQEKAVEISKKAVKNLIQDMTE